MALGSERKEGIAAATEQALELTEDQRAEIMCEAEQLEMWKLPVPDPRGDDTAREVARRGPGRPKGSKNKRTEDWTDFILRHYPSPLEALARIYSMSAQQLADELKCTRLEAIKVQASAAMALLPYMHSKQPIAVEIDSKGVVTLVVTGAQPGDQVVRPGDNATIIDATVIKDGNADKSDT